MNRLLLLSFFLLNFFFANAQIGFDKHEITGTISVSENVALGDFDGDNDIDIFSDGFNSSSATGDCHVGIIRNRNSIGTFGNRLCIGTAAGPGSHHRDALYSTDIDGDGDLDLIDESFNDSGSGFIDEVRWYENDGAGLFSTKKVISTNFSQLKDIKSGDIDNDGREDIIIAGTDLQWFKNIDNFETEQDGFLISEGDNFNENNNFDYLDVVDVDNDGDLDVIASMSYYTNEIRLYENIDGLGSFASKNIIYSFDDNSDVRAVLNLILSDLDNDGDIDVLSSNSAENEIFWLENIDSNGNFGPKNIVVSNYEGVFEIQLADLNNDGHEDLVSSSNAYGTVDWFSRLNDGVDFGTRQMITDDYRNNTEIAIADFNYDGKNDIFYGKDYNYGYLGWLENLGPQKNEIYGRVSWDSNNNGCSSTNLRAPNIQILTENGVDSLVTFTSKFGNYQLFTEEGNFKTSINSNLPDYFDFTPIENTTDFVGIGATENVPFCVSGNQSVNDVNIMLIPISEARPGFDAKYQIVVKNIGTTMLAGNVILEFDSKLSFLESSRSIASQTSTTLTFDYNYLYPFQTWTSEVVFNIPPPPNTDIGDNLAFTATVNPVSGDLTQEDNIYNLNQILIGSYDPNDITVLEGDEVHIEKKEDYLNYIIRFQNTGTASAINVKIEHDLDTNLNWETFIPIAASHDYEITISNNGNVEFSFPGINLIDDTTNELESHGHIAFKIKPKSNIVVGDLINGQASIYFDFNPPIYTNTVSTEFVDESEPLISSALVINPVSCPGANDAVIDIEANGGTEPYIYELWDENSNPIILSQTNNIFANVAPGNYITKVIDNNGEESFFNITISEAITIETTFAITNASCFGADNGQIEVVANNGTAPYQYRINGGDLQQSNLFENLIPNQYVIETIDINGCSVISETLTITEPIVLMANTSVTHISCKGLNDGSISINAMGGTLPYVYSLDGTTFLLSNEFNDITPGNYTVWCRDFNGCIVANDVSISEPNSPDFDNDGIGDECDDDIDGDGITNNLDNCAETPLGTDINDSGCIKFSLPNTNFSVQVVGETCASSNNGSILVTAIENLDYTATLIYGSTTIDKDFRTFVAFQDLEAGAYDVCIKVSGEPNFEQCFNINISQPEPLDIDAKVDDTGKSITLKMKGGENYTISINDVMYQTTSEEIILPLSDLQNNVQIKTDKDCQGIYEEMFLIDVSEILIFPNPVVGNEVSVQIPHSFDENIHLTLYANDGRMVAKKIEKNNGAPITLNVSGITSGIYNLNIETGNTSESRRIIIK